MPSQLTQHHKQRARMLAARLRSFAAATLGKSDLKIGPSSVADLMNDTAKLLDQMISGGRNNNSDDRYISLNPGRYFIRSGRILVRRPFQTQAGAEEWARANYRNPEGWAVVPPDRR